MNVLTRAANNARTGCYEDSTLVAHAVASQGIRKLFTIELPGDARGCEAQPLYVGNLKMESGTHNVLFSATMANSVFAHNADTGELLWERTLGLPVKGNRGIDGWSINDNWGILSTPVIDDISNTMYLVAWISKDGSSNADFYMFAINILNGQDAATPIDLDGATYQPPNGLPKQVFRTVGRKQRASLLLHNGIVYAGFGSVLEDSSTNQGWILAVETKPFALGAAFTTTVKGSGGGVWQAGGGLAVDDFGFVYMMTGNGDFDGVTDFGESFLYVLYFDGKLEPHAWWSPWLDDTRNGSKTLEEGEGKPSNVRMLQHHLKKMVTEGVAMPMDAYGDMDLGSGAPMFLHQFDMVIGAGKDGILYAVDAENPGNTKKADLDPKVIQKNYAKLKFPPVFLTYYPGPQYNAAPDNISELNMLFNNQSHHQHGELVSVVNNGKTLLYCWGENGNLRAWNVTSNSINYLACSAETASANVASGMPGGMISASSDPKQPGSAIIWASVPYGDANQTVTPGRLLAYDATNFTKYSDGSRQMRKIWDSQDWGITFSHNKFNRPIIADGKLFVATYDGNILVFGNKLT